MAQVNLVVRLRAAEGKADELARFFHAEFVRRSRTEPGCLQYDMWGDPGDAHAFVVIESWASQEDFERHGAQDWFLEYRPRLGALLDGAPERGTYTDTAPR